MVLALGLGCAARNPEPMTSRTSQSDSVALDAQAAQAPPPQAPVRASKLKPGPKPRAMEYPLDRVSRKVAMTGPVQCPPVELVDYAGDVIPYHRKVRVYVEFVDHLRRFETIVRDTAVEVYGRAPTRIRHYGAYYCRRIRAWPYLISEHGLGNALDVGDFEFARLRRESSESPPAKWRGKFSVSMSKHWNATGAGAVHRDFLRLLAQRVIDSDKLFRVILGPADPKHRGHFHFDMAPFRIVNVF